MKTPWKMFALRFVALISLLGPVATSALGDFAYGVTLFDNQLISVDTTTGTGTLVGTLGTPMTPYGLASVGGNLYTFDSTLDVIQQISTTTAATVKSYSIGLSPGALLGQGGLAFQSNTVGFLTSALDPSTFNTVNNLYEFNIATGTSSLIAHTSDTLEALAFNSSGVLYGLGKDDGNLYTINTVNGSMTLVGNAGISIGSPVGGMTFGTNGMLYTTFDDVLYTLSTTTGVASAVNSTPGTYIGFSSISGLAAPTSAVPEPSSLIMSAMAFVSIGLVMLTRRRQASVMV